jgi:hypothetical protein
VDVSRRRPDDDAGSSVEKLLEDAQGYVARMPPTAGARELKTRLDQYRRTIESWAMRAPTDEQREALREQLLVVLGIAKTSAPTMKVRRPPE